MNCSQPSIGPMGINTASGPIHEAPAFLPVVIGVKVLFLNREALI